MKTIKILTVLLFSLTLSFASCKKDELVPEKAKTTTPAPAAISRQGFKLAVIDTGAVTITDPVKARVRCNGSIIYTITANEYLTVETSLKPTCGEYGYDALGTSHINVTGLDLQTGSVNIVEIYNTVTGVVYASFSISPTFASPFNATVVTSPANGVHCTGNSGYNMGLDTMLLITFK